MNFILVLFLSTILILEITFFKSCDQSKNLKAPIENLAKNKKK